MPSSTPPGRKRPGAPVACRGDHRLPEADPAIVAGNARVREHAEADLLETPHGALGEQHILEHAAAQRHRRQPVPGAERVAHRDDAKNKALLNPDLQAAQSAKNTEQFQRFFEIDAKEMRSESE